MNREKQVLQILKEIRPDSDFENCSDFIEEFYLDSFDIINLANELESAFGIKITGDDIIPDNFVNIEAICGMIKKLKGE